VIRSICVFCGSSHGARPEYDDAARTCGREIARRGLRLVYGGGNIGMMGELARAALGEGGEVLGVIPRRLYELVDHVELSGLVVVSDMHERKARMAEESDAFIALPGGIGTFEEVFEAWTWRQIGFHAKPVGLLDVAGFYRPLLDFLARVRDEGFLKASSLGELLVDDDPGRLIEALDRLGPPAEQKLPERHRA
jgi:hypothetical protein